MSKTTLMLTPHDPLIARDGRPFGSGQGNRMHSLPWLLPSVVAGSLRTALVKTTSNLDFDGDMPKKLMGVEVAGVFPVADDTIYFPAPNDALAKPSSNNDIPMIHRLIPQSLDGKVGCDFPDDVPLNPVMLSPDQSEGDFKPASLPAWWPLGKYAQWMAGNAITLDNTFLDDPIQETREHVSIDPKTGTAAEGLLFSTCGLNVAHLPRYAPESPSECSGRSFAQRNAKVTLACRVQNTDDDFKHVKSFDSWQPMGGERRLIHWKTDVDQNSLWSCPKILRDALLNTSASKIRMALATPAIFEHGWLPGWLDPGSLQGKPFNEAPTLKLVGISNSRWKAVSGWSLAPPRGPKSIRRMVPAGSVYFFEKIDDCDSRVFTTEAGWLCPVSDAPQDQREGFGLALWGVW